MALKAIQLSKDLITVAEFKDHAGSYLDQVVSTGHPLVITKNGIAAGVLVSPEEYDRVYTKLFMESVAKGVAEGDAGLAVNTDEAKRQVKAARETRKIKK
ncbi:MAG: type II toxin-antitoxin system Phd/YefM family antitoxin [Deltaproteobacteria bacterium]|nr:type II toxin-antitoxin system Phd/YefM family antitoxin [Deltaproteobacteria bacterium]